MTQEKREWTPQGRAQDINEKALTKSRPEGTRLLRLLGEVRNTHRQSEVAKELIQLSLQILIPISAELITSINQTGQQVSGLQDIANIRRFSFEQGFKNDS